jgi:chitinase
MKGTPLFSQYPNSCREYPGAPDRGGNPDDTKNYVELLKTLKSSFDNSGRSLGLTFTAPSSFWYLRWFDLPGIMKHADWVNLVSLDRQQWRPLS